MESDNGEAAQAESHDKKHFSGGCRKLTGEL
jgi:hypothetical protein